MARPPASKEPSEYVASLQRVSRSIGDEEYINQDDKLTIIASIEMAIDTLNKIRLARLRNGNTEKEAS